MPVLGTHYPILSVNTGVRALLGTRRGQPIWSAIHKHPVASDSRLYLGTRGLQGDEQVDLDVHGGRQKAIYFYPGMHYAAWSSNVGRQLPMGSFGENVTLRGKLTEHDVTVGTLFSWNDVVLCVTDYRRPCFKLGMHLGASVPAEMVRNGLCGWYAEVIEPTGLVSTKGSIKLIYQPQGQPTIAQMFQAAMRRDSSIPDVRDV